VFDPLTAITTLIPIGFLREPQESSSRVARSLRLLIG